MRTTSKDWIFAVSLVDIGLPPNQWKLLTAYSAARFQGRLHVAAAKKVLTYAQLGKRKF